jgi:phosphotransferase system  glucose/maltose/N-acetylglucosamine-specific IIC component
MNHVMQTMNRLKRALGLPETISVLGLVRMCPLLVFFSLLILAALAVLVLH